MRNYARKKSTANKVSFVSPSWMRNKSLIEDKAVKARYCREPIKGKSKC